MSSFSVNIVSLKGPVTLLPRKAGRTYVTLNKDDQSKEYGCSVTKIGDHVRLSFMELKLPMADESSSLRTESAAMMAAHSLYSKILQLVQPELLPHVISGEVNLFVDEKSFAGEFRDRCVLAMTVDFRS